MDLLRACLSEETVKKVNNIMQLDIILKELEHLRQATILTFSEMTKEMLDTTGPARDVTISVRALGFALIGHTMHHMDIIREKYLIAVS